MTFLFLWITYFLLGIGDISGVTVLNNIGGYVGLVTGFFAMVTAFNIIMSSAPGRKK